MRLVLAGEIGQVRDMIAAVTSRDAAAEYHRTVQDAVNPACAAPASTPTKEG